MNPSILLSMVEMIRNNPLSISICEEIYTPCRHNTNQVRSKSLEQCAPSFDFVDGEEDLESFAEVKEGAASGREGGVWVDAHLGAGGVELGLVEVGLEAGFEDVERGSEGSCCHASDSGR